jgi:positive regulator of sigma E activity
MKPTVPETGTIIRIEGENAVIQLKSGGPCKGCGMGKIGLCRAGDTSMLLTAKNIVNAGVGETVLVGLDRETKIKGYFLAYLIPLFALLAGTAAGHMFGGYLSKPYLDVIGGFLTLPVAALLSFRQLRKLNENHMMVVNRIIADYIFSGEVKSEEERWYPKYSDYY